MSTHSFAAEADLEKLCAALKKHDVNTRDRIGRTALHWACTFGDVVPPTTLPATSHALYYLVIKLLIGARADVNARDHAGYTPLHLAVARGDGAAAAILLKAGADVDAQTARGDTPLYVAAYWNRPGALKVLLGAGAARDLPNARGKTPAVVARQHGHDECVRLLECA